MWTLLEPPAAGIDRNPNMDGAVHRSRAEKDVLEGGDEDGEDDKSETVRIATSDWYRRADPHLRAACSPYRVLTKMRIRANAEDWGLTDRNRFFPVQDGVFQVNH